MMKYLSTLFEIIQAIIFMFFIPLVLPSIVVKITGIDFPIILYLILNIPVMFFFGAVIIVLVCKLDTLQEEISNAFIYSMKHNNERWGAWGQDRRPFIICEIKGLNVGADEIKTKYEFIDFNKFNIYFRFKLKTAFKQYNSITVI